MAQFMDLLRNVNGVIWSDAALYVVLAVGLLFTVWSGFGQYRALTHGAAVIRGKYDSKQDPGAINHFQALSTALSATVGLGNIAGVALAISLGGPGAVFWMWVTGFVGMALKLTEVTQAMLYRNTTDPENPHGGAMWVCQKGFAAINPALKPLGTIIGGIFCITLLVSAATGGNMFQAWNVADISKSYFDIPWYVTGIVVTVLVGLVIIGGIKRIGSISGRLVPLMCGVYLLSALLVLAMEIDRVPAMFRLIITEAFSPTDAAGAFLGGTAGFGFLKGMQRALFSSEAGQGSAPIAHSAAKTHEPVREGVVAGLEPFIDTIVVCTLTAIVILLSGTWNRSPALRFAEPAQVIQTAEGNWTIATPSVVEVGPEARNKEEAHDQLREGIQVFVILESTKKSESGGTRHKLFGELSRAAEDAPFTVNWKSIDFPEKPTVAVDGVYFDFKGATLTAKAFDSVLPGLGRYIVPATVWLFAVSTIISWSYYGEQGVIFLFGARAVLPYKLIYCALVLFATSPLIATENDLDVISTFGTGVMLWANIPIMLIFGPIAMKAYREYMTKLKRGDFEKEAHTPASITDVVEGKDVL